MVVIYGAAGGLGAGPAPASLITQASVGVPGTPEASDGFGSSLAVGAFNVAHQSRQSGLAVGVPGENGSVGIVQVLPGQAGARLGTRAATTYSQDTAGVVGSTEAGDEFGRSVATFTGEEDSQQGLVVGSPGEDADTGAMFVLPRNSQGQLTGTGSQRWSQGSAGVDGVPAPGDRFGQSLVIGPLVGRNVEAPGHGVVIGVPNDDVGSVADAGSVNFLLNVDGRLSTAGQGGQRIHQNIPGVAGTPEPGDRFGLSVTAPHVMFDEFALLLIGAPGEDIAGVPDTGLLHQMGHSLLATGSKAIHLNTPGVQGTPNGTDLFGFAVN